MRNISLLKQIRNVHLVGIGGSGMSGLAALLLQAGKQVTGSDREDSPAVEKLRRQGIRVLVGQKAENVNPGIDLVVYSHAITPDNPELRQAATFGIPLVSYPEALGLLMQEKRGIAVAGTHGKTTTSALTVMMLKNAGLDPSFVIGGEICGIGNSGVGKGDYLVVEACEYRRSFLFYYPEIAVITNIDEDHLDYYRNLSEIEEAFGSFASQVKPGGCLVICAEEENLVKFIRPEATTVVTYGLTSGHWQATDIEGCASGTFFYCSFQGKRLGRIHLPLFGRHNVLNALAVTAVGKQLGIDFSIISRSLASFPGVHRRMEIIGEVKGILVMDDYGHHPTEIRVTLQALKTRYPGRRLIAVFQPHQYSRTRFLLEDFAASFQLADRVILPDIYFVRDSEREKQLVNSALLAERIRRHGRQALYLPGEGDIIAYLKEIVSAGDIVLTIGAGPINRLGQLFVKEMEKDISV